MHVTTPTPPVGAAATSGATASGSSSEGLSLAELVDRYMRAYGGRDPARAYRLTAWCAKLGPDRSFVLISGRELVQALQAIGAEPARTYQGRDVEGKPIHRAKGQRSSATLNRYATTIGGLFRWAIDQCLAPDGWESPARRLKLLREQNARVRFLDDDERKRLLEACSHSSWSGLYSLVLMAITTGARRGELARLTWADVDLERAIATVRASKNGDPRCLPLVPAVVTALKRLKRGKRGNLVFGSRRRTDRAFNFDAPWARALREARIRDFRFHDCRHCTASYLAQQGASLLEIADVLGHRQLKMTQRYSHLTVRTKAALVNRILGDIK